jgi:hypothetical protein
MNSQKNTTLSEQFFQNEVEKSHIPDLVQALQLNVAGEI